MSDLFERLEQLLMPRPMRQDLLDYSASQPDEEVCGLIGGVGELAVSFYRTENTAEHRATSYFMGPQSQIDAMRAMRRRGEQMLGIFHSHPNSPPEPSPTDIALAAYPGVAYVIASLEKQIEQPLRAFLFEAGRFTQLDLHIVDTEPH